MNIKICGITNQEDALHAISLGAKAIGFIFHKESPRYIRPEKAEEITLFLPPFIQIVGVFVNQSQETIKKITEQCRLDIIQLHGNESPSFCLKLNQRVIKAFHIQNPEDLEPIANYQGTVSGILLDTKITGMLGGTGKVFDWGLALKVKELDIPIILSGGINATNIKKAITMVQPYAIDLCSGVENEPGKKDYNKMKRLIEVFRSVS